MKSIQIENKTIQIPDDRYDELVKEFCGSKRWKPSRGDRYYYVTACGNIVNQNGLSEGINIQSETGKIKTLVNTNNCFRTKTEAEEKLAYINALAEINEYIAEIDMALENIDWNDNWEKFFISYNYKTKKFVVASTLIHAEMIVIPYLKSKELALDLIANQSHNLKVVAGVR